MLNKAKIRIFLWSLLSLIVVFLLWQAIVPGGHIVYTYDFSSPDIFVSELTPTERTLLPKNGQQLVIGDPVYFDLYTPRHFEQAKVSLTWQNDIVPVMEVGLLENSEKWQFNLQPLDNKFLNELYRDWGVIEQDGVLLLQRQSNFNSLDEFLNDLPLAQEIALYNYNLPVNLVLPNYQATGNIVDFNYALNGGYQFYTYIDREELYFDFFFNNLNSNIEEGAIVEAVVYNLSGEVVLSSSLILSNVDNDSVQNLLLQKDSLADGVYRLELTASNDVITSNIKTKQSYLSFINQLKLAENDQPMIFYTDSQIVRAQTEQASGLQSIMINEQVLDLPRSHEQFSLSDIGNNGSGSIIELEHGDVMLSGKGVFTWSKFDLLNPNYQQVNSYFKLQPDINYVVARYDIPSVINAGNEQNVIKEQTVDFDLNKAQLEDGKYRFVLSLPELLAEDEIKDYIILEEIKIELFGKTIWQKLRETLQ